MLVSVSSLITGTLKLKPVLNGVAEIVKNLNFETGVAVVYIEDDTDKEIFIQSLKEDEAQQLVKTNYVEIDMSLNAFLQYFPEHIM